MPNLFIVGAPKCGTTALYEYLKTHGDVFLPWEKEPHFLATDFPGYRRIRTWERYQKLYQEVGSGHRYVCDASVFYLLSEAAIEHAERLSPQAKYIVMVRNPIDMSASLHAQHLYSLKEDEEEFERAWELQEERARGQGLPRHCPEPSHLQYEAVCKLGAQVERLYARVPAERVKVIVFDDFKADPRAVYREVLGFLQLADDGRVEFPRVNAGHVHRFRWLSRFLMTPPFPLNVMKRAVKSAFELESTRFGVALYNLNRTTRARPGLRPEFQRTLAEAFASDIDTLSTVIGRDLSHWYGEHIVAEPSV